MMADNDDDEQQQFFFTFDVSEKCTQWSLLVQSPLSKQQLASSRGTADANPLPPPLPPPPEVVVVKALDEGDDDDDDDDDGGGGGRTECRGALSLSPNSLPFPPLVLRACARLGSKSEDLLLFLKGIVVIELGLN